MARGSTLPLTQISTKDLPVRKTENPAPTCAVSKFWKPQHPAALRASPGLYRDTFTSVYQCSIVAVPSQYSTACTGIALPQYINALLVLYPVCIVLPVQG